MPLSTSDVSNIAIFVSLSIYASYGMEYQARDFNNQAKRVPQMKGTNKALTQGHKIISFGSISATSKSVVKNATYFLL